MGRYIGRQILTIIPTILLSVVFNFLLLHAAPGDPARIYSGMANATDEQIAATRAQLGLDQSLPVQFLRYVEQLLHGNLGNSLSYRQPVLDLILDRLPATLLLTLTSAVIAFVVGVLLGAWTARRSNSKTDVGVSFLNYALFSIPSFWLGLIFIVIFASKLDWFPTSGMRTARAEYTGLDDWIDVGRHLVLPMLTLILVQIPIFYRVTRASVGEQQSEAYVQTLRNAILPPVTVFGLNLGYVVTGAALVEIVFAWPGIGRLALDAVYRRDYPLLLGIYLILAVAVSVCILLTDVVYAWLDPRIRLR
jgi:peptide/nickel transport system permease protein